MSDYFVSQNLMENLPRAQVGPGAYLTLHYRLASQEGNDIVTTFNGNPATLHMGSGQLAPFLENRLLGLAEGAEESFTLTPAESFGERNPDLVQRISRDTLAENSQLGEEYKVGDVVEFAAPSGGRFAGVLLEISDKDALFDFNHPLSGQTLRFDVRIISVL